MDYEKAYKESFEAAKGLHDAGNALTKKQMEIVFPQLAESEDERIRTRFIEYFQGFLEGNEDCYKDGGYVRWEGLDVKSILAWLEKQKEQKPRKFKLGDKVHWHDDGTNVITITGFRDDAYLTDSAYGPILFCDEDDWEKIEQKPAEWSEEDETYLQDALWCVKQAAKVAKDENGMGACWSAERWLKSLRPQSHWKPSEEQMKALLKVVDKARELHYSSNSGYDEYDVLRSLYKQLKEL